MDAQHKPLSPGAKLKRLRESLHLTLREAEKKTQEIAAEKKNAEYIVCAAGLPTSKMASTSRASSSSTA
jgi:DNA-binding GntR family transcriptional regulator